MRARLVQVIVVLLAGGAMLAGIAALQPAAPLNEAQPADPTAAAPGVLMGASPVAPGVPVVVALVRRQDVPITLSGIGAVAALNTVTIRSRVDGQLVRLNFAEGQIVAEGDVLAQIDPAPFEATLRQMTAALHRDQARLTNATADLGRYSALAQSSFASRQSVDTQQATVEQIGADIEADQAQIENARLRLSYTTIRSPIAGRVGFRLVDAGNLVDAADRSGIVVVTQQQPIAVVFSLPEHDLGPVNQRLTAGRELRVTITSRDAEAALASGVVATIDSAIDQHTATFRLKALFANKDLALWPGQFVKARLLLTTRRDGLVVPAEAVQRGPDGAFAFVVTASGTVEMRPITVAQIADGTALIDRGLEARERVVIDGQYRLRPGSRVTVVEGPA